MKPKWQKLASLAQEICTLYFQFFGAVFASKGYPFKNIFHCINFLQLKIISLLYNLLRFQNKSSISNSCYLYAIMAI